MFWYAFEMTLSIKHELEGSINEQGPTGFCSLPPPNQERNPPELGFCSAELSAPNVGIAGCSLLDAVTSGPALPAAHCQYVMQARVLCMLLIVVININIMPSPASRTWPYLS